MSWTDAGPRDDPWRARPQARPASTPRPESLRLDVPVDADGCFGFALFLAMLFASQLGTLSAALLLLLIPTYAVIRRRRLWAVFAPRWLLLLPVVVAGTSVFWSEAPGESAKFALEFAATVVGALLLAGARNPHNVLRGLFLAFAVYLSASIALGHSTAVGNEGGSAFSGLTDGKNLLGDIAASGLLVAAGVIATSRQRGRWPWAVAGLAGVALALYAVVASRSAGALMGLGFGAAALVVLLLVRHVAMGLRAVLFGFVTLCLVLGVTFHRWLATAMLQIGADLFDKDATLTGRTYLWYRAQDLIEDKPALGHGFQAFWLQGNTDAEGLWRYAGISNRGGFTFHNTLIEGLVQVGWVGVVAMALPVLAVLIVLVRRCVSGPTVSLCVWTGVLFYELVRMPVEAIGLAPLYFSTMLTFMALGFTLGRPAERRAAPARSAARAVQVTAVRVLDPQVASRRLLPPPQS